MMSCNISVVGLHCKTWCMYVCLFAYMGPYTENLNWIMGTNTFQICTHAKARIQRWRERSLK